MNYVNALISLLNEFKGWILTAIGVVTGVMVAINGMKYQKGTVAEKQQAIVDIRSTLEMGGGIFFLVWLAIYVSAKMAGV